MVWYPPKNIVNGLYEIPSGWWFKEKAKILWTNASISLLWASRKERNRRMFSDKSSSFDIFCENLPFTAPAWSAIHNSFCNKQRILINLDWKPSIFDLPD